MMTVDPNFLLIGVQKCGTSWLSQMIRQHPDIYTPHTKELHFFNKQYNYERGIEWYRNFFSGYSSQKAIGEFTPNYFWICRDKKENDESGRTPNVPNLIKKHYPQMKLILLFRDPVDRAISAYFHHIGARRISPASKFSEVWQHYGILSMGFYYSQLCDWLKIFSMKQFLIFIYEEDIAKNKNETLRKVFRFLGVDENFCPQNLDGKYNVRPGHLYMHLHYFYPSLAKILKRIIPKIDFPKIKIEANEIKQLKQLYSKESRQLESLLDRNLGSWKMK
jgi:hypothetical protein